MFNFKDFSCLFKLDYNNIFEKIACKNNKAIINDREYNNILSGLILVIISTVICIVLNLVIANIVINNNLDVLNGVNKYGIKVTSDIGVFNIISILIPLLFLIVICINKKKLQNSRLYNLSIYYSAIMGLFTLFRLVPWIASFSIDIVTSIFGVLFTLVTIIGYLFIILGSIIYCIRVKCIYDDANMVIKKDLGIKTSSISVNDVSIHSGGKCPKCGRNITGNTCSVCNITIVRK